MSKKEKKIPVDRARLLAPDYHDTANAKLKAAHTHLENYRYRDAVQAAQECCEFSMKAIYGFLGKQYSMVHHLIEEEYREVLKSIPEQISHIMDYGRLFGISQFWASWRSTINYGVEKIGVGASKIFKEKEAKLAVEHAYECRLGMHYIWEYWNSRQR